MAKKDEYYLENVHCYNIDEKNRNIFLHAEFEENESGIDFRVATRFIKNLLYLDSISNDPITIHLISYGGCWNYGMAIYDAIKKAKSEITTISYGHARSMSSIIPQAAKKRLICKHADFMIHYGSYSDEGDMRKVVEGIKHYEKANEVMLNIYAERCIDGQFFKETFSKSEIKDYLKGKMDLKVDWWLNAEEAIYYGFMDEIY